MLDVSCVTSIYSTVVRSKKPVSWDSSGDLCLVVIEFGEVQELVKDSAFYRWVGWVSDGLACEDSDYEGRQESYEEKK